MAQEDPNLGPSRLQLLIDSLASGGDIFGDPVGHPEKGKDQIDEVGLILGDAVVEGHESGEKKKKAKSKRR